MVLIRPKIGECLCTTIQKGSFAWVNLMSQKKSREYPSGQYGQEEIAVRYQTSLYTGTLNNAIL